MPHEAVKLYELTKAGEYSDALELWSRMIPSLIYIWHGDYIPAVKAASRIRGFDGGSTRKPVRSLSSENEKQLQATLAPLDL